MRRIRLFSIAALALLVAGCVADGGNPSPTATTASVSRPLLPPPPPPVTPEKPRSLAEPDCKALISHMTACSRKIKDKEKKAAYQKRIIEVAETLGTMDAVQRKTTCKADLPSWRKDCGAP